MHPLQAFPGLPIFLDKHCDLSATAEVDVGASSVAVPRLSPLVSPTFDTLPLQGPHNQPTVLIKPLLPFSEAESCLVCLKSALVLFRALHSLSHPEVTSHGLSIGTGLGFSSGSAPTCSPRRSLPTLRAVLCKVPTLHWCFFTKLELPRPPQIW